MGPEDHSKRGGRAIVARDRRRYRRIGVTLDVTVKAAGNHWQSKTVDLSPYGVKVALSADSVTLTPGMSVQLQLALRGGNPSVALTARVVRTDPDGMALNFVDLGALHFARLRDLVDSLLQSLSRGSAPLDRSARPLKDRRKSPRIDAELEIRFNGEQPYGLRGSTTVNLSPFGVKVALPAMPLQPSWGTSVLLQLALPDGLPPISVKGVVWRRELHSTALLFVELGHSELERLKAFVESLRT